MAAAGYQHIRIYDVECQKSSTPLISFEGTNSSQPITKNFTAVGFGAYGGQAREEKDSKFMYTGGEDGTARLWDLRNRQLTVQRIFQVRIRGYVSRNLFKICFGFCASMNFSNFCFVKKIFCFRVVYR